MNYTQNYHLPQWEESDRIMRSDFNQTMTNIENGISEARTKAENAQSTANTAVEILSTHEHYLIGRYAGAIGAQTISIGFRPKALLIERPYFSSAPDKYRNTCCLFLEGTSEAVTFCDEGFSVRIGDEYYPQVNLHHSNYIFIAFR